MERCHRVVIIGGGVIGASVAHHLARGGERDVLLLEKSKITEGCTWHAAGLVGQLRGKRNLTRMMQWSVAAFDRLEGDSERPVGWKKVGSLRLASSPERWSEIRRSMTHAKSFGVECEEVGAKEAKDMFPHIAEDGIEGAAFIPGDGYIDPYALTQAFAAAARSDGATIMEGEAVIGIEVEGSRARAVVTDRGRIQCEIVVNCAGLWAKRVGEMAGVSLAAGVVEHQYFLTEKKLDLDPGLTTLRDPDHNFYLKPDTGAFCVGGWEEGTKPCWDNCPPMEFGRELFPPNFERLGLFAEPASRRIPVLGEIGVQTVINGPIPVSADGEPIMGLAPELDNFFVACGFTAGIAASGGAGEAMANWILRGDPGMDLWAFDVRRFGRVHSQSRRLSELAVAAYGNYYKIHFPGAEAPGPRNLRRSALHERLRAAGAVFGSKFGWERPNWFAPEGADAQDRPSFEGKPNWFDAVGKECRAIRGAAALIDQSSFSKFEVSGIGAAAALDRLIANRLPDSGFAVYTQMCNDKGGIEADLTVARVADDRFMVVTGAGFAVRDRNWIERNLPQGSGAEVRDITNSLATINVCGPASSEVLREVSGDFSEGEMPFLSAREIEIAHARALAVRIGYVGEMGWELYVPQEYAVHVYDALLEAGSSRGIANAGYRAIESCRLEKGYLYWSSDIGPDVDPYEAGLGFCVAPDKEGFIGRDALLRKREQGGDRKLATLTLGGFVPLHGSEPILADGEVVGAVTSAGYGHSIGCTIALGMVPSGTKSGCALEVEAYGKSYPAKVSPSRCLYDPKMERLKG